MAKMNRYDYIKMMREKQHMEQKEERLNSKTEANISDPTPLKAVDNIIADQKYKRQYKYTDSNVILEAFID